MAKTENTAIALIETPVIVAYEPTQEEITLGEEMAAAAEYQEFLNSNGLAEHILPATSRVTAENIIVPAGEIGSKERWFIKKNLVSFDVRADKSILIVATKRQLKDRGISL